jgi:hypothetical protein
MKMKTLLMFVAILTLMWYETPSGAEDQASMTPGYEMTHSSDLIFKLGKTAEEAGLADAGSSKISGTVFGHPAQGSVAFKEHAGKQVISGMDIASDISYEECYEALKALYDIPFETNMIPYVEPYGAGINASFFTGSGTVTVQQMMKAKYCTIHISSTVPDEAKIKVLPVTLEQLNAYMEMDLRFDESRYKNLRIARIRHGDNSIWRIKYSDQDGKERRVYMQKRQTNIVPAQFDPDVTWKQNWEHFSFIGEPDDPTGRNLTSYEYDEGGMGCVSWYKNGNFAVLMFNGATKDRLKTVMEDIRDIISKADAR